MSIYCPAKSPKGPVAAFPLRSALVFFVTSFGFYVCYFSSRQIIALETEAETTASGGGAEPTETRCTNRPAIIPHGPQTRYVHFPRPATYDRGECVCNPVRFFVIVSTQRSGSGWVEALLNSHPNVSSNGEVFSMRERRQNLSSVLGTLDRLYGMDWLTSAAKNECTAAFGFKWMLNQGLMENHRDIVNYLNRKGAMVVFLFRRNTLRRLISVVANNYDRRARQLNGVHKSHVHSKEEAEVLARFRPELDAPALIPSIRTAQRAVRACLRRFGSTRHMVLYYEDVVRDSRKALSRVQEFLGVPARELSSKHVKIHTRPLPDLVGNWEEVRRTLSGTEYSRFIDDDAE